MKITNPDKLFSGAWDLYKQHFLKIIALTLIPVAGAAPVAATALAARWVFREGSLSALNPLWLVVFAFLFLVTGLFAIYVGFSAQAGILVYLKGVYNKKTPQIWESFNTARKKYLVSYLGANIVYIVIVALWFLVLIVPGIIFMVFYLFGTWLVVFKDKKALSALEGSVELVKGYWWAIVGRLAIIYIIIYAITSFPIILINDQAFLDMWSVFTQIFSLFAGPFVLFYLYLIFTDLLKVKKQ
jgi:hypothetical protein